MVIMVSELYGKQIITNTGQKIGMVEDIIIDLESKGVSSLLLTKMEDLVRAPTGKGNLSKNTVNYERVSSVSESIIVKTNK